MESKLAEEKKKKVIPKTTMWNRGQKHAVGYTCAYGNQCITMMRWFQFIEQSL